MKIETSKVAAISYKLSASSVEKPVKLLETVDEKKPMHFLVGHSGLPPKFEDNLQGLVAGDSFSFSLRAEDAFGNREEDEVMDLPLEEFLDEKGALDPTVFKIGALIPMMDEQGHHVRGRILEINLQEKFISMDFNHPLAGEDLHFEGKIISVRDASKEEMEHGHVHGEGGHHH